MDQYSIVALRKYIVRISALVLIVLAICLPAKPLPFAAAASGPNRALSDRTASTGHAASAALGSTPDVVGQWGSLLSWPLVAVHGALLNTGQVLMWDAWEFGSTPSARLWDPNTGTFTGVPDAYSATFCAGQVALADGRELVAGGHNGGGIGIVNTVIFDPLVNSWTRVADMNLARWYPTTTALSDGRVLVLGGDVINST